MKKPENLIWYPVHKNIDSEGNFLIRIPSWLVRAYRLNQNSTLLMGRIKLIFNSKNKSIRQIIKEEKIAFSYFKENWNKKLIKKYKGEKLK